MTVKHNIALGAGLAAGGVMLMVIFAAYHTTGMALALDVLSWCF